MRMTGAAIGRADRLPTCGSVDNSPVLGGVVERCRNAPERAIGGGAMRTIYKTRYIGYVAGHPVEVRVAVARSRWAESMTAEGWSVRRLGPLAIGLRLLDLAAERDERDVLPSFVGGRARVN